VLGTRWEVKLQEDRSGEYSLRRTGGSTGNMRVLVAVSHFKSHAIRLRDTRLSHSLENETQCGFSIPCTARKGILRTIVAARRRSSTEGEQTGAKRGSGANWHGPAPPLLSKG
jgi:hypothetical protein